MKETSPRIEDWFEELDRLNREVGVTEEEAILTDELKTRFGSDYVGYERRGVDRLR